jgi:hypothetical protein
MHAPSASAALRARIGRLVDAEGPLPVDEICRRVAACWGVARLTDRVRARVAPELAALAKTGALTMRGAFVWPRGADPETCASIRGPAADGTVRDAELLAPEEVAVAATWVLSRSISMDEAGLVRETARVFGITRVGKKVEERMRAGIDVVCARGLGRRDGDRVVWIG